MRKAQRLSLQQLAEMSGTSVGYLSDVENDKREPTERWLRAVEVALAKHMLNKDVA